MVFSIFTEIKAIHGYWEASHINCNGQWQIKSNHSVPRMIFYPVIGFTRLIILCLFASLLIITGNIENWIGVLSGESKKLKIKWTTLISVNTKIYLNYVIVYDY